MRLVQKEGRLIYAVSHPSPKLKLTAMGVKGRKGEQGSPCWSQLLKSTEQSWLFKCLF